MHDLKTKNQKSTISNTKPKNKKQRSNHSDGKLWIRHWHKRRHELGESKHAKLDIRSCCCRIEIEAIDRPHSTARCHKRLQEASTERQRRVTMIVVDAKALDARQQRHFACRHIGVRLCAIRLTARLADDNVKRRIRIRYGRWPHVGDIGVKVQRYRKALASTEIRNIGASEREQRCTRT